MVNKVRPTRGRIHTSLPVGGQALSVAGGIARAITAAASPSSGSAARVVVGCSGIAAARRRVVMRGRVVAVVVRPGAGWGTAADVL